MGPRARTAFSDWLCCDPVHVEENASCHVVLAAQKPATAFATQENPSTSSLNRGARCVMKAGRSKRHEWPCGSVKLPIP
eukprot:scaffold846_cov252-Pinguiococcus_pyrenoidosus.AAC.4